MTTDCQCELAGFCARHKVKKNAHWHDLCQTKPSYFSAWERGEGPGQRTEMPELVQGPRYNHWAPLHWYAVEHADNWNEAKAKAFYRNWKKTIPNTAGCGCQAKWKKLGLSPDFTSARDFFEWSHFAHDTVTARLIAEGKTELTRITLEQAYAAWDVVGCLFRDSVDTNSVQDEVDKGSLPALSKHASTFEQFNV